MRIPAAILLAHEAEMRRASRTPEVPAFSVPVMFERALRQQGFEPQLMAPPTHRRIFRDGLRHFGTVRRFPVVATVQGYGCLAASLDSLLPNPASILLNTWKVPWTGPSRATARLMDHVLERTIRISRLVVVASHEHRRMMAERYPEVRTVWVPVTADIDWFKPGPVETDVLDRLGVAHGEYLLSVGDVDRDETVPVRVAQRFDRALVRVTRNPETKRLAEEAFRSLDARRAHCLVRIPYRELRDLYRGAWAVLGAPALSYHPAGLTGLTEALAMGVPMLFPRNATAEGYVEDGVDALLYDGMSAESVSGAAARLSEPGVRERICRAARETAEKRINYDGAVAILTEAIASLNLLETPRARRFRA